MKTKFFVGKIDTDFRTPELFLSYTYLSGAQEEAILCIKWHLIVGRYPLTRVHSNSYFG